MLGLLEKTTLIDNQIDIDSPNEAEVEIDDLFDDIKDNTYQIRLKSAINNLRENGAEYFSKEGLKIYSPKFLHILENIQDSEHVGLHLIYSQFRTLEGIGLFAETLKYNGFAQFKLRNIGNKQWIIDMAEEDMGKPTFALYTGTETAEEKEIIRNIYNGDWEFVPSGIAEQLREMSVNNNMGEIIRILMITSSGSEGINLKNTRYVHIMEPYWHPVRMEQVIGRARRICSHKSLPLELQTVEVFLYLMKFTKEQLSTDDAIELKLNDKSRLPPYAPVTSDQLLYEISQIKQNFTNQLTEIIKQTAFDCYLYNGKNCVQFLEPTEGKFAYIPDYSKQENDKTIGINKQKIEWEGREITIRGKKYIGREMDNNIIYLYDYDSFIRHEPIHIATIETNAEGKRILKTFVS